MTLQARAVVSRAVVSRLLLCWPCRYNAIIVPIIAHICKTLLQPERRSSMKDENGQVCLENRDLDILPRAELAKVDSWLKSKVDEFNTAACKQVELLCFLVLVQGLQACSLQSAGLLCSVDRLHLPCQLAPSSKQFTLHI